ncbi:MAG: creatininase family protein [Candidatus Thermoplasmatota archaeon]|nr:creatininase family protein [Candidatus Thermoplasmatota archaeon]MBS3801505.1 creatininase family protein [Candidatus Thermoplasmatota archaeon]
MENMNNDIQHSFEKIIRFEELSWKQIDALDQSKTIFLLPISPLEEHGPHLPVGTDLLTAQDTAQQAIIILQKKHPSFIFVLLPFIPLGFAGFNTDFPGTVSVSSNVIKKVIYAYGKMLASQGFMHLLICTYHVALAHLKGIHAAKQKLRRKYDLVICEPWSAMFYSDQIAKKEPKVEFDTKKEVHAGFRETSLMKYTHPGLVDSTYKDLPLVFSEKIFSPISAFKSFKQLGITQGYVGSPSKADESYGKWFFDLTVETYVDAAERMIQKKPLPELPKHLKRQMKLLFWL